MARTLAIRVLLVVSLWAYGGSFSGCALEQKAADFIETKFKAMVPILEEKATAAAEKALADRTKKRLVELDQQLALIKLKDEQGHEYVKTWQDFSADKGASGHLTGVEAAKAMAFITEQTAKQVAAGEITKDEGKKRLRDGGIVTGALGLLYLAAQAVKKFKNRNGVAPTAPAPPA